MTFPTAFRNEGANTGVEGELGMADDLIIERMLGGSSSFLSHYWQRHPLYSPGSVPELIDALSIEEALADIAACHQPPYLAVSTDGGERVFSRHGSIASLRDGIDRGEVATIKASRFWHGSGARDWPRLRAFYTALCRKVLMTYLSPERSEDVDIFLAGPNSSLGAHFDTTDVFTVQLVGERRWIVEDCVDLDRVMAIVADDGWYPAREIGFNGTTREIILRPGDALYVPAYSIHEVTGVSWSISLSLGLRAFTAFSVVDHAVDSLRRSALARYRPARTAPETTGDTGVAARIALLREVRAVLSDVEGAILSHLMQPLTLPDTLEDPPSGAAPPSATPDRRSGFALFRPN